MNLSLNFISLLAISLNFLSIAALPDETLNVLSALKGRTYFAPKESVSVSSSAAGMAPRKSVKIAKPLKYIESESASDSGVSESSSSISESESSVSESESSVSESISRSRVCDKPIEYSKSSSSLSSQSSISASSVAYSDESVSSCSSSSSISEGPICRLSRPLRSPLTRIDYQRPWCPGQVMASLVPRALDPIYDWNNPLTCAQFASNFGGVSVVVGELDGPVFCKAGPTDVTSTYTLVRSLSINQPIYARAEFEGVEFAAAAGPIFLSEGLVYFISVAKEVSKLPQVCN